MRKIRKGDRVVVLTGRDKGKSGEVVRVIPKDDRVVVAGVNLVSKHQKPGPGRAGGIERIEAAIHISNVAHLDPETDRPTRVGFRFLEDNRKVRYAKRSGEVIDR